jgi:glycosyltransferase involved in cell wall biosynthesis
MGKRILIFSLSYYPFVGGAEVAIKEVLSRLPKDKYSFDLVTLRFDSALPRFEKIENIDVFRIGFTKKNINISDFKKFPLVINKYLYPFWACVYGAVLHRRKPYEAVFSIMTSYSSFAPMFLKLIFPNIKYIVRADDGDPIDYYLKKTRFVSKLFKWVFSKADIAVATSKYLERFVKSMGYAGDVAIVPNGANMEHFSKSQDLNSINELKVELGKKVEDVYLITTSRLVTKNAVDDVIRSLKFLDERVKFLILGVGPDKDLLMDLSEKEGVGDRVKFVGQVGHDKIPLYFSVSDIFIRPSITEGFGISFIEAMAAGLPVIATQEGGIADFLYDPEINKDKKPTGRAVKVRDPEDIARQVKNYLNDKDMTEEIIKNAKDMVFERYDWSRVAKLMDENVFSKI